MIIPSSIPGKILVDSTIIDFNPIIDTHKLKGAFVLMHWNKIIKLYGFWDNSRQEYLVSECQNIAPVSGLQELIEIHDKVLPSAVVLYRNFTIRRKENMLTLEKVDT